MKNSIPSEVWEKKKPLIARLYKEEEWPLKQVIKQIRTEDFNPSETQLRSRLKKWRVTKPSRQTRKKPGHQETDGDDDDGRSNQPEDLSPVDAKPPMIPALPPSVAQVQQQALPVSSSSSSSSSSLSQEPQNQLSCSSEWYSQNEWLIKQEPQQPLQSPASFNGQNLASHWVSPKPQQPAMIQHDGSNQYHQSPPVMQQYSTVQVAASLVPYEQIQPVTTASNSVVVAAMQMMTPPYHPHTYPVPQTCGPPDMGMTTTIQWPNGSQKIELDPKYTDQQVPESYSEDIHSFRRPSIPSYCNMGTPSSSMPGYPNQMQPIQAPNANPYIQQASYADTFHPDAPEQSYVKTWRRAGGFGPDSIRVDRQGRQRRPMSERKRSKFIPTMDAGVIIAPGQPQFVAHEQHPMMSANMYPYHAQGPFMHAPPGSM